MIYCLIEMTDFDSSFKVLLIGDYVVKKKLINILFPETINSAPTVTLGIDFYSKVISNNTQRIRMMIWNPITADRFYIRLSQFLKDSHGAIITCDDIDSRFLHKLPEWNQIIKQYAGEIPIILIRLEKDRENPQNEKKEDIIPLVKNYITDYIEILASESEEGEHFIGEIAKKILNYHT